MRQPDGPGSFEIVNDGGTPGDAYFWVFSFSSLNVTDPGGGWWAGLHVSVLDVFTQFLAASVPAPTPPWRGTLDECGRSYFSVSLDVPPGLPIHAVTRSFDPVTFFLTDSTNTFSIQTQ